MTAAGLVQESCLSGGCATRTAITVVTVTYNSSAVLPAMLMSVPPDVPTIVVDNGSHDGDKTATIAATHNARLIRNEENVGFGRACNQGANQVNSGLILFLNPDAVIVDDALDSLANATNLYPQASAFNPAIEGPNGIQSFRRSSPIAPEKWKLPRGWPDKDREVSVLSGAALLVRKSDFDSVGGFDPNIFLYHEDDDLCLRLQASYGPLMFVRNAKVIHDLGNSSGSEPEVLRMKSHCLGYSFVYASLKHGKPMAFERALLRAARRACSPVKLTSARQRAERFGYLNGVLSAHHLNPTLNTRIRNWFLSFSTN